jgi:hypothetical protein
MVATRTMLTASWSLQRADHGERPYWALILLAACLGQIGLPGGGLGFGYGSSGGIAEPPLAFRAPVTEILSNPLARAIPAARIADCLLRPGCSYDFNGRKGSYPDIRLVYWAGGNPFHHYQDLNRLRSAWPRPETIIVHNSTDGANPFLAFCLNRGHSLRRKLEHGCFLTHQQVSQQYLLPVGKFQEIMMMVVLMGLPKGGHRVIDHYHVPSEQTARAAPYRRCEGKLRSRKNANRRSGIFRRSKSDLYREGSAGFSVSRPP